MIYLIGALANPQVPLIANRLRAQGFEVFDAWYSAGPDADTCWRDHERLMGHTFQQALAGPHAQDVYHFDELWLSRADTAVLVLPAGKSGHLELGWVLGRGKRGFILLNGEPDRFDVMYNFATGVCADLNELVVRLREVA
uniref:Nucleoside 2-deoxyribosyltransferase n=1 Tax=viral metagenome TaxID=1070528 RepID=A0A6M3LKU4_9ZZZZ